MIQYLYLGRVGYDEALRLQAELVDWRYRGRVENVLLLLEHPPVLTLGRNADRSNVLASDDLLAARGVTLHEINRGGDVTYHGPGQLVGYPIFDLRSLRNVHPSDEDLHPTNQDPFVGTPLPSPGTPATGGRMGPVDFVRQMEEALIRLCGVYGVPAARIAGLTGVWCSATEPQLSSRESKKIGAIGIHVSRGITSHGFAFNVTTNLDDFRLINPCGITDRPVTSLEREMADPARVPGLESIAHQAARQFGLVFGQPILAVESLDALRAQADAPNAKPPAEDTPLQVPPEVERLRGHVERPVRA
jgi:lipoyl(octanoyl) transferase